MTPPRATTQRPRRAGAPSDRHEFRPVLAEIEERPVSPLGRTVFWIVVGVMVSALLWACLGTTDVVITLRGRLVPQGDVKTVQPLETGVVREILVREGQRVKQGDPLILLESAATDPTLEAAQANLAQLTLEMARLQASASGGGFAASGNPDQAALYQASMAAQAQRRAAQEAESRRIEAAMESNRVEQAQTTTTLQAYQAREQRMARVLDIIPKDEYVRVQDEMARLQSRLQTLAFDLQGLREQQRQAQSQMRLSVEQFRTQALSDLQEKRKQANELLARQQEVAFRRARQTLVAPVDGVIERLVVHTRGAVVTPAEPLMTLVPDDAPLVVQATAQNRDIGFIRPGMAVSLKLDAYDFQKYGMIDGRVVRVSQDSQPLAVGPAAQVSGPGSRPESGEAVYRVEILPARRALRVDNKPALLMSGMTLSGDVHTGERRLIEFFIYPLVKHFGEGVSVR